MNECKGNWYSILTFDRLPDIPIPIGWIIINDHQGTAIDGYYIRVTGGIPQRFKQDGTALCITPSAGGIHIVKFTVLIDGEEVEFRGIIKDSDPDVITSGAFKSHGPPELGDTGTWEASKEGLEFLSPQGVS